MSGVRKARAPADLGDAGRKLWDAITRQVADDGLELDARDLGLLREAATTKDELARLEAALADVPVTVAGSTGQVRTHPLFDEVRKSRTLLRQLLSQLDLVDPTASGQGGQGNPGNSTVHRAAAHTRWRGTIHGIPGGGVA